ncbi:unnamed protein product [Brassica napus]|uniref:(rape) hypothetical protein n=1 Tax=Brassica napus TaxID=3708 RepID=A0A817BIC5_BRANA|nr:unnamed protein product [Brassica napus]
MELFLLINRGRIMNAYLLDQPANESYKSLQTTTDLSAQNQDVAVMVNASEVTKVKTLTIRETFAFLKQEPAQAAFLDVCIHVPSYDKGVPAEILEPIVGKWLIPVGSRPR